MQRGAKQNKLGARDQPEAEHILSQSERKTSMHLAEEEQMKNVNVNYAFRDEINRTFQFWCTISILFLWKTL